MNPSLNAALSLWPASASAVAVSVDRIILCFTLVTLALTVPIFVGFTWFAIKYREGRVVDRTHSEGRSSLIEISWMVIPFLLTLVFFVWAARLYIEQQNPPGDAMVIQAIGRQWMWKFQHPGGQQEINDLHVPTGQPVRIDMISQDVIHALYIPALRLQMDAIPGRYTSLWFKADRAGEYHLFCSEYCGTDHSLMGGLITIMQPADYQAWLSHTGSGISLVDAGQKLFASSGCAGCHGAAGSGAGGNGKGPTLAGLYGQPAKLADGGTATVDDGFVRGMILDPGAHLIAGYPPIMPGYKGLLSEDQVLQLVDYVKSLPANPEQAR